MVNTTKKSIQIKQYSDMICNHTFLVPTYRKSPYLEQCLQSLRNQSVESSIFISTSTPFEGLDQLARYFNAELFIHSPNQGMAHDWNVGLEQIKTPWVTIAHQDDIYKSNFTESLRFVIDKSDDKLSLVFTDYDEIIGDITRSKSALLLIKHLLLLYAFRGRETALSTNDKIKVLRFGNPIPCPSVSINLSKVNFKFDAQVKVNMDWIAWLHCARQPGGFHWIKKPLMSHRLHKASETSSGLTSGARSREDLAILQQLWPKPIAWLIHKTYAIAYRHNQGN
jgi:glycosyltransferase involved in cell wall biosynthesis